MTEDSIIEESEIIWTRVETKERKTKDLFICSFYMPHREMKHMKNLDSSLKKITEKSSRSILLCGDFNCPDVDWDTHGSPWFQ